MFPLCLLAELTSLLRMLLPDICSLLATGGIQAKLAVSLKTSFFISDVSSSSWFSICRRSHSITFSFSITSLPCAEQHCHGTLCLIAASVVTPCPVPGTAAFSSFCHCMCSSVNPPSAMLNMNLGSSFFSSFFSSLTSSSFAFFLFSSVVPFFLSSMVFSFISSSFSSVLSLSSTSSSWTSSFFSSHLFQYPQISLPYFYHFTLFLQQSDSLSPSPLPPPSP
jgi:hypothetical protein